MAKKHINTTSAAHFTGRRGGRYEQVPILVVGLNGLNRRNDRRVYINPVSFWK
jgi:hypothetical protein